MDEDDTGNFRLERVNWVKLSPSGNRAMSLLSWLGYIVLLRQANI